MRSTPFILAALTAVILYPAAGIAAGAKGSADGSATGATTRDPQPLSPREFPGIGKTWLEVSTDEFKLLSSAPKKRVASAIAELEAFRAVLRVFFPTLEQTPRRKTYVYLFGSSRQFQTYGTDRKRIAGFFLSRPEANYIAVDGTTSDPFGTIFHEYVHYLLRNNAPGLPLWLNEGLAEYFEGFRIHRGHGEFGGDDGWGQYLAAENWLDYRLILGARVDSELYRDPANSATFRAQAWALTHFLYDPTNRQELVRFMAGLAAGQSSEEALLSGLETTLPELEKTIRNHLRKVTQQTRLVELRGLPLAVAPAPQVVHPVEVLTRLGQLLAILPTESRTASAHRLLDEALRRSPEHVAALTAKAGLLVSRNESLEEASRHLDRALTIDGSSAEAHYLRGRAALRLVERRQTQPRYWISNGESLLALARESFEQTLQLDPHFRRAANDLAHTYLYDRELASKGIEIVERELQNGPHLQLAVTLMELYASTGDRRAAWKVHDEKVALWMDANAEGNATAFAKSIEQTDLLVAQAWAEDGRCEEATELLRQASERTVYEDVGQSLESMLALLEGCTEASAAHSSLPF